MKTYDEYMDNIQRKAKAIKKRRRVMASTLATVFVLVLAVGLFRPWGDNHVETAWSGSTGGNTIAPVSAYSQLAQKLKSIQFYAVDDAVYGDYIVDEAVPDAGSSGMTGADQTYQEVTDNQVAGVIEGDLFKRSDKYLYYLNGKQICIYTIDKENSKLICSFPAFEEKEGLSMASYRSEMFLSADCKTLTVVGYGWYDGRYYTVVSQLDVSDPENVRRTEQVYFVGLYLSARMVDGDILLNYQFTFNPKNISEDDLKTFVPTYGALDDMQPVNVENIYCYDQLSNAWYTVVARLGEDLAVKDTVALVGYSTQIYVSDNCVYLTCPDVLITEEPDDVRKDVTTIAAVSYAGEQLQLLGTVQVDGELGNQYYMDEYEGILRVATSTWIRRYKTCTSDDGEYSWKTVESSSKNCNLYCIDMTSGEILASVVGFAPEGEEVTSARFDGTNAYICTAETILLTDPVYFFDLSDVHNITYKHTPVIDGYSFSLINFGDHLLGIGVNADRNLKVEVYRQTENAVESVACYEQYEQEVRASSVYKSYLIDREKKLVGIPILEYNDKWERKYLLLYFDGYQLSVVQELSLIGDTSVDKIRSTIIDDYLYVLSDDLQVVKL